MNENVEYLSHFSFSCISSKNLILSSSINCHQMFSTYGTYTLRSSLLYWLERQRRGLSIFSLQESFIEIIHNTKQKRKKKKKNKTMHNRYYYNMPICLVGKVSNTAYMLTAMYDTWVYVNSILPLPDHLNLSLNDKRVQIINVPFL